MNRSLLMLVASALVALSGCSLVLDLPADCRVEDCGGYQCNAEGTGCLLACEGGQDCGEGFVCDGGRCLETGCSPQGELIEFLPAASTSDLSMAYNGEAIGAVHLDATGLVFTRVDKLGRPQGSPLGLALPGEDPKNPALIWNGDVWAVVWEASARVNGESQEQLRFAVIDVGGEFDVEPKTLWFTTEDRMTGRIEKSVDGPSIDWDEQRGRFAVVWTTVVDTSDVYLMIVNKDGTSLEGERDIPHSAGVQITFTQEDAVEPIILTRSADVYDVAYREGAASVNLVLRTVSLDGQRQGTDVNISTTQDRVLSHGHARITTGTILAFTEQSGDEGLLFRAQIKRDRAIAGGSKLPIEQGFDTVRDATVAGGPDAQYAAVFVAERDGRSEVFMARFKDNGARIAAPFSLTDLLSRAPSEPVVASTDEGFVVLHQENEGAGAGTVLGRHWICTPPE